MHKDAGRMKVDDVWFKRVDRIELYRESPTWQGLAVKSRSSTSLLGVGSDSWFFLSMLDVAVYLYTAGYHLLDLHDTQYCHKVTCHFLITPTGGLF